MRTRLLAAVIVLLTIVCQADAGTLYRGAVVGPLTPASDIEDLGRMGANVARFQLSWAQPDPRTHPGIPVEKVYREYLSAQLQHLDTILPTFEQFGMRVIVSLHAPPAGTIQNLFRMFHDRSSAWAQPFFLTIWKEIAERYRGNSVVLGYDLLNEPWTSGRDIPTGMKRWQDLAVDAIRVIRTIDPTKTVIYQPPYANPDKLRDVLPVSNVVYSVHIYTPEEYTHMGVNRPFKMRQRPTNAAIESNLQSVVDFHRKHKVRIYIGEFSAVRWAPEADDYLHENIKHFEKHGFDWTYHSWRESHFWDAERKGGKYDPAGTMPRVPTTSRKALLQRAFSKNMPL